MNPVEFPEHNTVYAKDQPGYLPIPVFKNNSPNGEVVSCWKLSFAERLRILFTGRLWMMMLTFNQPLTPSFLSTQKKDVLTVRKFKHLKKKPEKKILLENEDTNTLK